jgi:hypothetical protein
VSEALFSAAQPVGQGNWVLIDFSLTQTQVPPLFIGEWELSTLASHLRDLFPEGCCHAWR